VKRVLLTGMSGTGKSSVIEALAARGYKAVDTDAGWCEPLPDGRQRWREHAIEQLLATEDADVLFVAGCEDLRAVEPLLRRVADHEISTTMPLSDVVTAVLRLTGG
jgi:hypothetical protein